MGSDILEFAINLKKDVDKALRKASIDVAVEMQKDFNLSMNEFYDSYHPRRYRRTYSTYKASSGNDASGHFVNPRKLITGGDGSYTITLTVDGSKIPADAYSSNTGKNKPGGDGITASEIFSRVWDQGIHGFTAYEIPDFYAYYMNWTIPPQTTPPDEIMAERFGRTASGSNLDSIISKYLKF